ncbi:MalY/PatB family protein [Vagococcus acidifermentans]|uniref:cysteine-S-conjugate beta-lyase n=1 Tax=Vagococcus acidifermentans TaxID=564710 RepID=A0A430B0S8_9ENTE|nr:MalY/PatB family protein [Vagococcus acidifermentans]RSU13928.1 cystathionine beta-lyase [Vagococcus acidifermentans]
MNFNETLDRRGTYCTQWDFVKDRFGTDNLLPFTISDTDFALPDEVTHALNKRLSHPVFGYTRWNHTAFKEAVVGWYRERMQTDIQPDWLMYSPSVIYSVSKLIELHSDEGQGVVMQTPAYDAFFKTVIGQNRRVVDNPLIYHNQTYTIDFADLEEKLSQPENRILLLCSPHNPTGRVWREDELQRIVELCLTYHVFLIADEIHMDVLRKGQTHLPILKMMTEHVALVSSGSKTFNFPGLIFSYVICPDEHVRDKFSLILKNRDGLSSTSTLGMIATMTAYNECGYWVDELNSYIDGNIAFAADYLKQYLPDIRPVHSEATYLMWLDTAGCAVPMADIQEKLINKGGVAIMDGSIYGGNGSQFLRLNVGCPQSKLQDGLERMKQSLTAK